MTKKQEQKNKLKPKKHDIWLKCVADGKQVKAGYLSQLITNYPCSPGRALDIAQETAQKYQSYYGGEWAVMQGTYHEVKFGTKI